MTKNYKQKEQECARFIVTGCLVMVAIIWFFFMAYVYLSWVILPTFFNDNLSYNPSAQTSNQGYILIVTNLFLNAMLMWCLLLTWKGNPGFVYTAFKSVIASEQKVSAFEDNDPLTNHFIATGETSIKEGKIVDQIKDASLRVEHIYQVRHIYTR